MKGKLAVIAATLAIVAAVVFGTDDRQLMVPPPDAVAEAFARQLATRRYDLATKYLASDLRAIGAQGLRSRYEPMRTALGKINHVDAHFAFIDGDRAGATATIEGENGRASMPMQFRRERHLWVLGDLPEPPQPGR